MKFNVGGIDRILRIVVGIVLIVGGLTFLPSLALGPVADHLAMVKGQLF